jgi:hypothetical protein
LAGRAEDDGRRWRRGGELRYFIDTEFIEQAFYLDPITIAVVAEDGREFYAGNKEHDASRADAWVHENVLSKLPPPGAMLWMSKAEIAAGLRAFVGADPAPEFWAYYASYDWVLFCWLLGGRMIDIPKGWPMYCMDLRQVMRERGIQRESLPPDPVDAHNALADARWGAAAARLINEWTHLPHR